MKKAKLFHRLIKKIYIRQRSLPNIKNAKRYGEAYLYFLAVMMVFNFIYITLFSKGGDFTPMVPEYFLIAIPIIFATVYFRIENTYRTIHKEQMGRLVMLIQLKHNQTLIRELDELPEAINLKYQKKTLVAWAKHYNNVEAHSIITKKMISNS